MKNSWDVFNFTTNKARLTLKSDTVTEKSHKKQQIFRFIVSFLCVSSLTISQSDVGFTDFKNVFHLELCVSLQGFLKTSRAELYNVDQEMPRRSAHSWWPWKSPSSPSSSSSLCSVCLFVPFVWSTHLKEDANLIND